ncbi:MAG: DEAD/DEAH box helicase, partial [Acidimicrobiales bacterium]
MSTFAEIGVPAELCARLERRGIVEPFPIQALTIPDAFAGRDICGRAPTGSGKTLAFGLAIAVRAARAAARRPRSLVLVPTRELAVQVAREIDLLVGRASKGQVVAIYGGASYGPQRRALARGAAVVVACPGRLEDLVAQEDVWLDDVDLVVVDEADRLADMGFLPAVRRLLDLTSRERQTLLFSATLDGDVDALVRRYQEDPVRHEVVSDDEANEAVDHVFWRAEPSQRLALVRELVDRHGRAIVFCRTRRGAERVAKQLKAAGVGAQAIHGNRTQGQRERALAGFMDGRVDALVATDVAARGIHVDDVACVIHFDLPADSKDYIHRSGRTGRAGASGTVVSLVANEHRRALRALQRSLGIPEQLDAPDVVTGRPRAAAPTSASGDRTGGQRPPGTRPTPTSAGDRTGSGSQRRRRRPRPVNG